MDDLVKDEPDVDMSVERHIKFAPFDRLPEVFVVLDYKVSLCWSAFEHEKVR